MAVVGFPIVAGGKMTSATTFYYTQSVGDAESLVVGLMVDTLTGTAPYLDIAVYTADEAAEDTSGKWRVLFKFPRIYDSMVGTGFVAFHEIRNFLSHVQVRVTGGGTITNAVFSIQGRKIK